MKAFFRKKSKQYSNISEPVNYSDLDPAVIQKLKQLSVGNVHLNTNANANPVSPATTTATTTAKAKQSSLHLNISHTHQTHATTATSMSTNTSSSTQDKTMSTTATVHKGGSSVSRTNSNTTHATLPSMDPTELSSASLYNKSPSSTLNHNHNTQPQQTQSQPQFPAPPDSPVKSKRKLFLLKKKQVPLEDSTTTNNNIPPPPRSPGAIHKKGSHISSTIASLLTSTSSNHPQGSLHKMISSQQASTTASTTATTNSNTTSTIHPGSLHASSAIVVTPDTKMDPSRSVNDGNNEEDEDDEYDAITDAPTEFFYPAYLFKDHNLNTASGEHPSSVHYDNILNMGKIEMEQVQNVKSALHATSQIHSNVNVTAVSPASITKNHEPSPPPPPSTKSKKKSSKKNSSSTPAPSSKESPVVNISHVNHNTRPTQNHPIFQDQNSTSSDMDKTFDPEIVSVASDITSPTFQTSDHTSAVLDRTSSNDGKGYCMPSDTKSWKDLFQHSLTKTCSRTSEDSPNGNQKRSFWDAIVDGLCSAKPVSTISIPISSSKKDVYVTEEKIQ